MVGLLRLRGLSDWSPHHMVDSHRLNMIIYSRELKPGDMFLVDPLGIAPPLHSQNLKLDLYFVIDVRQEGPIAHAWYHFKMLRMDHDGSPMILDLSAGRSEVFTKGAIPLRFQEMDLHLSDPIPEYSE